MMKTKVLERHQCGSFWVSRPQNEFSTSKLRRTLASVSVLTLIFGTLGMFFSPNILAANGAFDPPYSDYGMDTQGDSDFDHLVLNVSVDITEAGVFNVYGGLYDSGFSTLITEENSLLNLPLGNSVVPLMFSGADIYNSGLDGQYGIWLTLYDDKWLELGSDSAQTSDYNHTDFQHLLAEFSPPHYDLGVDTNEDLYHDHLLAKINITVGIPGTYKVEADLFDSSQSTWITDGAHQSYYTEGNHTIDLPLLGCRMRKAGIDGPYKLQLKLRKDGSHLVSEDVHDTATYAHSDFDGFSAYFTGASSDVVNLDGDLLNDYLRISVDVEVNQSGVYRVEADLFDATFHLNYIASTANSTYLIEGTEMVDLYFIGHRIYDAMSDDKFVADLVILDSAGISLVTYSHTTAEYSHIEFEHDIPALLSPPHDDHGLDSNADGYYDSLILNISVESLGDWGCSLRAKLYNLGRSVLIADMEKKAEIVEGVNIVTIFYNGDNILNSGIDGPYEIGIYLYDHYGNILDKGTHITRSYKHDEFKASTQTPSKGEASGTVVDEDGNPIPGARVELMDGDTKVDETYSDDFGEFTFLNLDDGIYTLVISEPRYPTITMEVVISGGSAVQIPSLILKEIDDDGTGKYFPWMTVLIITSVMLAVGGSAILIMKRHRKSTEAGKER
jgi:hypothetical protein